MPRAHTATITGAGLARPVSGVNPATRSDQTGLCKHMHGVILVALALIMMAAAPPLRAGDPSFGSFVKSLEHDFGVKRTHIPMFWLAKAVVKVGRPAGCSQLDFAVFEEQDLSALASTADLQARIHRMLGAGWSPWVEVLSQREQTYLYMRTRGKDVDMMVFTVEPDEATAVLVRLNPDAVARAIADPASFAHSRGDESN